MEKLFIVLLLTAMAIILLKGVSLLVTAKDNREYVNSLISETLSRYYNDQSISPKKPPEETIDYALSVAKAEHKKRLLEAQSFYQAIPFIDTKSSLGLCSCTETLLLFHMGYDKSKPFDNQLYSLLSTKYDLKINPEELHNAKGLKVVAHLVNNYLIYCKSTDVYACSSIPKACIHYYSTGGAVDHSTELRGGGTNIGGAIVGGVLFGFAGAIVGSNVGTEVVSKSIEHDNRTITIAYELDGQKYIEKIKTTNFEQTIAALQKLLPGKDFQTVSLQREVGGKDEFSDNLQKLKGLKELLDSGIISQDEFELQKQQLLTTLMPTPKA